MKTHKDVKEFMKVNLYAKICHQDEGVVFERKFETEIEAQAFCEGFTAALDHLDIEDDSHFATVDDKPAQDEQ